MLYQVGILASSGSLSSMLTTNFCVIRIYSLEFPFV